MQISDEEQLKRFEERAQIEHKRFKITEEDWRNREKAEAYHQAVCDMVDRTSSGTAPWTIVESNDKYFARIKVLRTICERLERELKVDPMKEVKVAAPRAGKAGSVKDLAGDETQDTKADSGKESKTQKAKDLRAEKVRAAKEAKALKAAEASGKASATV